MPKLDDIRDWLRGKPVSNLPESWKVKRLNQERSDFLTILAARARQVEAEHVIRLHKTFGPGWYLKVGDLSPIRVKEWGFPGEHGHLNISLSEKALTVEPDVSFELGQWFGIYKRMGEDHVVKAPFTMLYHVEDKPGDVYTFKDLFPVERARDITTGDMILYFRFSEVSHFVMGVDMATDVPGMEQIG